MSQEPLWRCSGPQRSGWGSDGGGRGQVSGLALGPFCTPPAVCGEGLCWPTWGVPAAPKHGLVAQAGPFRIPRIPFLAASGLLGLAPQQTSSSWDLPALSLCGEHALPPGVCAGTEHVQHEAVLIWALFLLPPGGVGESSSSSTLPHPAWLCPAPEQRGLRPGPWCREISVHDTGRRAWSQGVAGA